jgi:D-ribose pyranase
MKRGGNMNRHLSALVASLGHLDEIVIADAGLPIPDGVDVIDLAVSAGVPGFWDVMAAVRSEMVIEAACHAQDAADDLQSKLADTVAAWGQDNDKIVASHSISHDAFKDRTRQAKAIIRTGECTPYCNVILISGVVF